MKLRPIVGSLLEATGIGFATWAGWQFAQALGCAVLGLGLIVFGVATERGGN